MKRCAALAVSLVALAGVVSCGGGGGDGGVAALPAVLLPSPGLYSGSLTGSGSPSFEMLVLEGGEFWAFYGTANPPPFAVASFAQGKWISNGGLFTSGDVRDYSTAPAAVAASRVSYNAASRAIEGSITAVAMNTVLFNGAPVTASGYNHDTPALLPQVAGLWTVKGSANDTYCLDVAVGGTFTGTPTDAQGCLPAPPVVVAGCSFTGDFSPRSSGKNVFDVRVTNGGAPCTQQGLMSSGVAYVVPVGIQSQLTFATVSVDRASGAVISGVR